LKNISISKSNILLASFAFSQILLSSAAYSQSITDNDERTYFNRAIIFGDSLSDNGTFNDDVTALTEHVTTDGRFSNGRVWNEYLFRNQKRGTIFWFKREAPFLVGFVMVILVTTPQTTASTSTTPSVERNIRVPAVRNHG
jgi:hypothetical protein